MDIDIRWIQVYVSVFFRIQSMKVIDGKPEYKGAMVRLSGYSIGSKNCAR